MGLYWFRILTEEIAYFTSQGLASSSMAEELAQQAGIFRQRQIMQIVAMPVLRHIPNPDESLDYCRSIKRRRRSHILLDTAQSLSCSTGIKPRMLSPSSSPAALDFGQLLEISQWSYSTPFGGVMCLQSGHYHSPLGTRKKYCHWKIFYSLYRCKLWL